MRKHGAVSRREFVGGMLGAAVAVRMGGAMALNAADPPAVVPTVPRAGLPTRPLGRTGHKVGLFSLGGQALLEQPGHTDMALNIINTAIDKGVNYLDTAPTYGGGISETYLGQVMKTRRGEVYLASKTSDRTYDGSMRRLEQSLKRLQTDHLDGWQIHHIDTQQDIDAIFAPNGAIKALEKARDQKMVRFLGVTGHRDPDLLRTCIERYPFDTLLMALNAADAHNRKPFAALLPLAVEKNLGIIAMKVTAKGRVFRNGGVKSMDEAMGYVLSLPVSTLIVGISDVAEVHENIRVARDFKAMGRQRSEALERATADHYAQVTFYRDPDYRTA